VEISLVATARRFCLGAPGEWSEPLAPAHDGESSAIVHNAQAPTRGALSTGCEGDAEG
jgi:hypothetical protein